MPRRAPLILLALLSLALAAGCSRDDRAEPSGSQTALAPPVEAVRARSGALPLKERVSGILRAENQVTIRPEVAAPIVAVLVRNGQQVRKGQPLLRLLADAPREQLRQAEAAQRLAEAALAGARARVAELDAQASRTRRLAEESLVSDLEVETLEAQLQAARASAQEAAARVEQERASAEERRATVERTVVRAPIAGVVGQLDAEVGMLASPGSPLLVMGDLEDLVVEVPITEAMLGRVSVGTPVQVRSEAAKEEATEAEISRISPFLRSGSFSTVAEIDLEDPRTLFRPGMFVTVDLLVGSSDQATLVPASALWEDPRSGRRGVFVVTLPSGAVSGAGEEGTLSAESHEVAFRGVEVIAEGSGVAGVRGLDPGQWVVTVGQHLLGVEGEVRARVRPTSWERVLELQGLRREDLLEQFLAQQQRWARERGARPPDAAEFLTGGTPP